MVKKPERIKSDLFS